MAAEFSLVTVDRAQIAEKAVAGDRRAQGVSTALKSLSFQLSGAQLGITLTALLTGYLAEPALAQLINDIFGEFAGTYTARVSSGLGLLLATFISMLCGELLPKNAAIARPMPTARWTAPYQRAFSSALAIPIRFLNGSANAIVRRLGLEPQEELASARSPEELGLVAALSARAGTLEAETARLLQRTIRFGAKRAAEAMTPRVDVAALPADSTVHDLLHVAADTGHSRFPLYESTLDQIVGVVDVTETLAIAPGQRASIAARAIAHAPVLVPESLPLESVLTRLREVGAELAVVVDEYGGTDGIITIEDLAEELVGEIEDEFDPPTDITDFAITHEVPGVLREDELLEQTEFHMPEGPYETLAGFLMAQLGHIPGPGEHIEYEGWRFTVLEVERHRVVTVRVAAPEPADEEQS